MQKNRQKFLRIRAIFLHLYCVKIFKRKGGIKMSRDFRPIDLFLTDRAIKEKEGHGLRDMVIIRKTDEEETVVASPESPSRKAYRQLLGY